MSSKVMNKLVRSPSAMLRFQTTGRLPREVPVRDTPLMTALRRIGPRLRCRLIGFTVGHDLGYTGPVPFQTAEQAFRWLGGYERTRLDCAPRRPADSRQIHSFNRAIEWKDLRWNTRGDIPASIEEAIRRALGE